jgi:catechol 2,3-dioxygenase-like lactoylglutathione lyase family enzyme
MALIDGFSHLVVQVTDLDRSEKFYQEVFGLDPVGRNLVNEEGPNSLLTMNTGQMVLLVQVPKVEPFRPNSGSIHHAWLLTDDQFARAQQRLKAMGFSIEDSREEFRAMGEKSLDVFDPDGHRYQVQAYGPEAHEIIKPGVGEVECGKVDNFGVGSVTLFGQAKFFLVRLPEGFLALSRWCSHMNGQIIWQKEHWRFFCPFHGATFNRKGEFTGHLHNVGPLRLHPIEITADGRVVVDTDRVIIREQFSQDQMVPPVCGRRFCAAQVQEV